MRLPIKDYEILVGNALNYYAAHKASVSLHNVVKLFGVNKATFINRLHNRMQSMNTNGG
jgi:hypothetical protein